MKKPVAKWNYFARGILNLFFQEPPCLEVMSEKTDKKGAQVLVLDPPTDLIFTGTSEIHGVHYLKCS